MNTRIFDTSVELKDNAMLKHTPEYFDEWNFERNNKLGLDVYEMTYKSSKRVWWKCKMGHEWETVMSNRTIQKSGCPDCNSSGRRFLRVGFNDLWTINPNMAAQLLNPEDGFKYMQRSNVRVDWKCLECDEIIKNKKIDVVYRKGISCPRCSDGIPYGEKFLYHILISSNILFDFDTAQTWTQRKRYDFYLPEYNWIIEVHGEQHFGESFRGFKNGRTFEEEQENDRLKERLAKENRIDKYIVIDARESTIEWLKNSILNSDITKIISYVDYIEIGRLSRITFIKESCRLWNEEKLTALEISKRVKVNRYTILRYLNRGVDMGWCDYSREKDAERRGQTPTEEKKHRVVQLSKEGVFIAEWESLTEASKNTIAKLANISSVCKGRGKTAGGFKWMYKVDYDSLA